MMFCLTLIALRCFPVKESENVLAFYVVIN
jgi:hypothetical protein